MRISIFAAVLLISTSNVIEPWMQSSCQTSTFHAPKPVTLASLRDHYRPLLVFAATDTDERFVTQAKLLGDSPAPLHERQVLLVPLTLRREAGQVGVVALESAELSPEDSAKARRTFKIAPDEFAVMLIGKDGGEKFRTHTPVTIETLITLIDAMPMRQQEVGNGNSK